MADSDLEFVIFPATGGGCAVPVVFVHAPEEQVADLERRFGRDGVVELTYQIALENLRSRMNSALPEILATGRMRRASSWCILGADCAG